MVYKSGWFESYDYSTDGCEYEATIYPNIREDRYLAQYAHWENAARVALHAHWENAARVAIHVHGENAVRVALYAHERIQHTERMQHGLQFLWSHQTNYIVGWCATYNFQIISLTGAFVLINQLSALVV